MTYDLKDLRVFIAIPVNRDFPWQTTKSLIETAAELAKKGIPFRVQFLTQGSQIDHDRSELARQFLLSDCNKLFWIDSDMGWETSSFTRLLALSTVKDIVGATYPAKKGPVRHYHIRYDRTEIEADEHGTFSILGMGLGFAVVDRKVMEELSSRARTYDRDGVNVPMIFRTGIDEEGVYRSEDMHFFKACRDLGYKVYVDPSIELEHVGGHAWKGRLMDALMPATNQPEAPSFRFPDDVGGWLSPTEGNALGTLATGKVVLEIGSYKGRSTICMAQTAERVVCIDPFDGRGIPDAPLRNTYVEFMENLIRYGIGPGKVIAHVGTTDEIAPTLEPIFDLVFVDGEHTPEMVVADITWARRLLKPGGQIAIHDYDRQMFPDVVAAVGELIAEGGEVVSVAGTLALVRPPEVTACV